MMCADFLNLKKEIALFESNGIPLLHIDIMDGHYVPNFTLGPDFCARIAEWTRIPLDIHLMIENVDAYAPIFSSFGSPWVCFHPEVAYHPLRTIALIRSSGGRPGIAIDPALPIDQYRYLLGEVDLVCVMAVNPGYAGQKLIPSAIGKIAELRAYLDRNGLKALIEVDGNVSWANIPAMLEAGADLLVAGTSSLFSREGSRQENLRRMTEMLCGFAEHA
jgi:ribulose-phosphate 3-epimerase